MVRPGFSFNYGGRNFMDLLPEVTETEYGMLYTLPDGLRVELHITRHDAFNAVKWMLYIHNTGSEVSETITDVCDCDISCALAGDAKVSYMVGNTSYETEERAAQEFSIRKLTLDNNDTRKFAPGGGKSSTGTMPFFNINAENCGFIYAVGWTGQWNASFCANDGNISMRSGIESLSFKLNPGERIRTSSVLVMTYSDGVRKACNNFRRLIKDSYSIIGKGQRPKHGLLCIEGFGMTTQENLYHIQKFREYGIKNEYYWVDASWYGKPSKTGFGEWATQVGNWFIREDDHPDRMHQIVDALAKEGEQLLMWFEPERAYEGTELIVNHRDWFYKDQNQNYLLNMGNKEAREGILEIFCGIIDELKLGCYRQDFNFDPLPIWRLNDTPDRQGLNEIYHIMGLYEFWEALLSRYPHLVIDNCAGGGRRIDIETLSRSVPIWRTDAYCNKERNPEIIQTQTMGITQIIPYSGGCTKLRGDIYAARSCYAPSYVNSSWWTGGFELTEDELEMMAKVNSEYLSIREYLTEDFYPIVDGGALGDGWTVMQYHRPSLNDGIIMAFRHVDSSCYAIDMVLQGLDPDCMYEFVDADSDMRIVAKGSTLMQNENSALHIEIPDKRSSRLLRYGKIQ